MDLDDLQNAIQLYNDFKKPAYQNALLTLLTNANAAMTDAIIDSASVPNINYIIERIRLSYTFARHGSGGKRKRFHIPTVEEIESSRQDAERRLTPANLMHDVALDMSTSSLLTPAQALPRSKETGSQNDSQAKSNNQTQSTPKRTNAPLLANTPQSASPSGRGHTNTVLVNELQRGNPVLACIRNVRWSYASDIVPDYVVGRSSCILYLSIKYHRLHPEYITKRIEDLGKNYRLRILLVYVDTDDSKLPLREINRTAVLGNMTLLLAWSLDEAGRYIETLKAFEHRQPDTIRERVEDSYAARLNNAMTSIRSVNKTDTLTLTSNFGSFADVAKATADELTLCPGIGDLKAQRLFNAFNQPFLPEN
ncbi:ssDNA endonuclease and repair protein rad10 [Dipsacomyces acuminosporus]|nr:ssDNA endonuclease and repair protein rad10 [Dipsacomyces acuminosporus]